MSISQIKKRFEEMAAYLGRDVHGIEKLRDLKESVNVVRTRLASAEAEAVMASETCDMAIKQRIAAESALDQERMENQRLRQVVANLTRDLEMTAPTRKEDETQEEEPSGTEAEKQMVRAIRALKKHIRICPQPKRIITTLDGKIGVFAMSSFATDWSHQSLLNLGAAVAFASYIIDCVAIENDMRPTLLTDQNLDTSVASHVVRWCRKNIGGDSDDDPVYARLQQLKLSASDYS